MLANSIVLSKIGILAFRDAVAAMKRSRSPDAARRIFTEKNSYYFANLVTA
jgi:hypothetical protein